MAINRQAALIVSGASLLGLFGCGGPGLPPAGPKPGETEVGYGTQPTEKVTGAVTTVSGSQLGNNRAGNIEELLRGRAAGLEIIPRPEGGYRFRIRGLNSALDNPPDPLFVIDGNQTSAQNVHSALAGMTRDDIRQVDVLKDIAQTSIYGTRGVGGVIIITTKRR